MLIPRSPAAIGIACALLASVSFTLNDTGIKFLSGDYALHQIVFIRSLVAMAIMLAVFVPIEGGFSILKTSKIKLHLLRGVAVFFTNMIFFMGLAALPLAEATAIFFVAPLFITIFSVIFLSEKVGPQRWVAVVVGMIGAFVIMRPGTATFQWAALFPVFAALGYATLHMMTRTMGQTEKASTMAFYTLVTFLTLSGLIGLIAGDGRFFGNTHPSVEFLTRAWIVPTNEDIWFMVAIGTAACFGGYFITQAYRVAEAALIAPFEYFALVLSIIWGVIVFNEWPDHWTWIGISLILAGGLFVLWRESVLKKRIASERPMPRVR